MSATGGARVPARPCGRSGLALPALGVGCWSFGGGTYWGPQDQHDADAVVSAALEHGCALFDTAEAYNEGRSEESLGKALGKRRQQAVIVTKILPDHCAGDGVRRACEASLRRLGTDYIDLYLLHWPLGASLTGAAAAGAGAGAAAPRIGDVMADLSALVRDGLVRHVGVSNFGPKQLAEAGAAAPAGAKAGAAGAGADALIAANQVPYSLLSRAIEDELLPACRSAGVGVLCYMPLMQGLLTGRYRSADELPAVRTRTRQFRGDRTGSRHGEPGHEQETFAAVEAVREIARAQGVSMEALALAWSVARDGVTSTISGARSAAQLESNARAVATPLPADVVAALDRATAALKSAMGASIDLFEHSSRSRTF